MAAGSVNTHGSTNPEAGGTRARRAIPWRRRPDTSGNAGYGSVVGNDRVAAVFATRHMTAEHRRGQGSIALITLIWSRLTCPALARRHAAPWSRKIALRTLVHNRRALHAMAASPM